MLLSRYSKATRGELSYTLSTLYQASYWGLSFRCTVRLLVVANEDRIRRGFASNFDLVRQSALIVSYATMDRLWVGAPPEHLDALAALVLA